MCYKDFKAKYINLIQPIVFDNSLSFYEMLCKLQAVVCEMKKELEAIDAWIDQQEHIIREIINEIIRQMVDDGTIGDAVINAIANVFQAESVNYFVSRASGSDSNPGSKEYPFRTIKKAFSMVPAVLVGSVNIYVAAGDYSVEGSLGLRFISGNFVNIYGCTADFTRVTDMAGAKNVVVSQFNFDTITSLKVEGFAFSHTGTGYAVFTSHVNQGVYNWLSTTASQAGIFTSGFGITQNSSVFLDNIQIQNKSTAISCNYYSRVTVNNLIDSTNNDNVLWLHNGAIGTYSKPLPTGNTRTVISASGSFVKPVDQNVNAFAVLVNTAVPANSASTIYNVSVDKLMGGAPRKITMTAFISGVQNTFSQGVCIVTNPDTVGAGTSTQTNYCTGQRNSDAQIIQNYSLAACYIDTTQNIMCNVKYCSPTVIQLEFKSTCTTARNVRFVLDYI